ncbi:Na+/H+ antiporter NhaA [Streptomyces sp. 049-1]|uniref:Na+/H+ antiporter NhaA n=1 Tax=Streptomyces sp. 049-1 TaxID=2789264 RepID=UPI003981514E
MQRAAPQCTYEAAPSSNRGPNTADRPGSLSGVLRRAGRSWSGLHGPSAGAAITAVAVVAALIWANTGPETYEAFWETRLEAGLGSLHVGWNLRTWVDSGLMTLFFLVVGLEARKEFDLGDLRERSRLVLPVAASLIAMAVPVGIYLAVNHGGTAAHGWGVAMSTDSALALGAFAMVARGVPDQVRTFLLTLFVVDDVVALLLVIFAYGDGVSPAPTLLAAASFAALLAARRWRPSTRSRSDLAFGVGTWAALMFSGIEPPVAGLLIGLVTSARSPLRSDLEHATGLVRLYREQPSPARAKSATAGVSASLSSNARLHHLFHPWTTLLIVPLFALSNAGIQIDATRLTQAATAPVTLGIVLAYVVGKPVAVVLGTWSVTRSSNGRVSVPVGWGAVVGSGTLAGVGFTVSLLIATLAFHGEQLDHAKIGILAAAVLSTMTSWAVYRVIDLLPGVRRRNALLGDSTGVRDLHGAVDMDRDHVRGPLTAPITIIEYGDFECPYCSRTEPATRRLLASHPDIRYVWRHLPLSDVHPQARLAAEAAEAAASQGAFWDMHSILLERQDRLRLTDLISHAEELGLDVTRFERELLGGDHRKQVDRHIADADANGVAGTPTFFINGKRHHGSHDVATMSEAIQRARAELRPSTPADHAAGPGATWKGSRTILPTPPDAHSVGRAGNIWGSRTARAGRQAAPATPRTPALTACSPCAATRPPGGASSSRPNRARPEH